MSMTTPGALRLSGICRTVSDIDSAVAFYCATLGFQVTCKQTHYRDAWCTLMGLPEVRAQTVMLRLGQQKLELIAFDPAGNPYPRNSCSSDLWFQHIAIVVSDIDAAYSQVQHHAFNPISTQGPQQLPPSSASAGKKIAACKFRDPDGHPFELIQFPPGAGAGVWQQRRGLFLGIDHSAIVVMDMERSIDFYARLLGLRIRSGTLNSGPRQASLDHLRDVMVNVVALQPITDGLPHIELLCYQRNAMPLTVKADDVACDRLVFQVHGLTSLVDTLKAQPVQFVCGEITMFPNGQRWVQVRDPTGHMVMLMEREEP